MGARDDAMNLPELDLVVLVHACAPQTLARSTGALAAAVGPDWSGRVVLVENAPREATAAAARGLVARSFPAAEPRVVSCRRNLGFAAGIDLGVLECRRPFVGFFNPDGALDRRAPAELVRALAAEPGALAAGAAITRSLELPPPGGEPLEREWLPGAAVVVRRQPFLELGGFDPLFFMYSEDVDLSRRAQAAGWTLLAVPAARFEHRSRHTRLEDFRRARQFARSSTILSHLHAPSRWRTGRSLLVKRVTRFAELARARRWLRLTGEAFGTGAWLTSLPAVERRRRSPWDATALYAWARGVEPLVRRSRLDPLSDGLSRVSRAAAGPRPGTD
jgi:GT2 family glycosyltransferase